MYRLAKEEQIGVDVVSAGEIFTAASAGFPMDKVMFHGNCKSDEEIRFALEHHVGTFVIDNEEELDTLEHIAKEMNVMQDVLIRITPGIDPHTYEAVATGLVDSKFGSAIETGAASHLVQQALKMSHIHLRGFHCHVGSQVFDEDVFVKCAEVMFAFMKEMKLRFGYITEVLNLGGGFGVRYVEQDPTFCIEETLKRLSQHVHQLCVDFDIQLPAVCLEPGRSIVADAGMTLYRVGSVKKIPGIKNYVAVDGGMSDNPRYALYRSSYTAVCANRMHERELMLCSLVGKCCESGDILQENVLLPAGIQRGDLIAVMMTGAYNYSMASNYNRIARPAVLMMSDDGDYLAVQRESFGDLIKNEM